MQKFNKFIDFAGLIDRSLDSGLFTWSNLRNQSTLSRIDRFLYTQCWGDKFPIHNTRSLSRICSDHFSILLQSLYQRWGPCPFRLENLWLSDKNFQRFIPSQWSSLAYNGHPGYAIIKKPFILTQKIKVWRRSHYPNFPLEKAGIIDEISLIGKKEETDNIDETYCHLGTSLRVICAPYF